MSSTMNPKNIFRRWLKEQFILKHMDRIEELIKSCHGRPFIGSGIHEFVEKARGDLQYGKVTSWRDIWYAILHNYTRIKEGKAMNFQIDITEENYLSLRKAYRQAVKKKKEDLIWQDQEVVTNFAKYVLEYWETFPHIKSCIDEPDPDE